MKARFLKRTETEKGETIKVVMEVPAGSKDVFLLERGKEYEIGSIKDSSDPTSPTTKLETAAGLIMAVLQDIKPEKKARPEEIRRPEKCGNCAYWYKDDPIKVTGNCLRGDYPESTPIYHWCKEHRHEENQVKDEQAEAGRAGESVAEGDGVDAGDTPEGSHGDGDAEVKAAGLPFDGDVGGEQ